MRGELAELMAETAPQIYCQYVTYGKGGKAILYVKFAKGPIWMSQECTIVLPEISWGMAEKGFILNPYDPCVANCDVNGSQMTITWHVDDLKISHVDGKDVTKRIDWFKSIYGKGKVSRGKLHQYLGMDMDFGEKGKLKMSMVPFLKKTINEFPEAITAAMPAAEHLFKVREEDERKVIEED